MSRWTVAGTYCGGTLTEILNDELDTNEGGFSRRRVVKGVAWTLPVLVTAVGAPPASASPGPVVTPPAATALLSPGTQNLLSTVSGGHDRLNVTVPSTLSLRNLDGVTGSISVKFSISPSPTDPAAKTVSLSTVRVGTESVAVTPKTVGNSFEANFSKTVSVGTTSLDFALSGYGFAGKKQDAAAHPNYAVSALVTFQQGGKTVQLSPVFTIIVPGT